jgi:hypothetical protein
MRHADSTTRQILYGLGLIEQLYVTFQQAMLFASDARG